MKLFKDMSKHRMVNSVRIFSFNSLDDLNGILEKFGKNHDIVNASTAIDSTMANTGLGMVEIPVYVTTVVYRKDATDETIRERVSDLVKRIIDRETTEIEAREGFPFYSSTREMPETRKEFWKRRTDELLKGKDLDAEVQRIVDEEESRDGKR